MNLNPLQSLYRLTARTEPIHPLSFQVLSSNMTLVRIHRIFIDGANLLQYAFIHMCWLYFLDNLVIAVAKMLLPEPHLIHENEHVQCSIMSTTVTSFHSAIWAKPSTPNKLSASPTSCTWKINQNPLMHNWPTIYKDINPQLLCTFTKQSSSVPLSSPNPALSVDAFREPSSPPKYPEWLLSSCKTKTPVKSFKEMETSRKNKRCRTSFYLQQLLAPCFYGAHI